jgi:hypothetical protein
MLLSEYDFIQAWLSNLSHGQVMGRDAESAGIRWVQFVQSPMVNTKPVQNQFLHP